MLRSIGHYVKNGSERGGERGKGKEELTVRGVGLSCSGTAERNVDKKG